MIERIHVRNFQALHDVEIEVGGFTVIVGPSSSGKSAFMRATRTLTSNRRGSDFISRGERVASITAHTDKGIVTLTRGHGNSPGDNAYTVTPTDPGHPLYPERIFTKLGGDTPPEVSQFLGIAAKDPINYAGQFDKPYLLDDSAGEVARTLGNLTNVSVIFEAARESNRRKLSASGTLRTKQDDLSAIREKIPTYRALKSQTAAIERAEEHIAAARLIERDIENLRRAVDTLDVADAAIARLRPLAAQKVPDLHAIEQAAARLTGLRDAIRAQQAANKNLTAARAALTAANEDYAATQQRYDDLIGDVSDSLAGWIAATADDILMEKRPMPPGAPYGTDTWLRLDEAIRIFTLYIETKATS